MKIRRRWFRNTRAHFAQYLASKSQNRLSEANNLVSKKYIRLEIFTKSFKQNRVQIWYLLKLLVIISKLADLHLKTNQGILTYT